MVENTSIEWADHTFNPWIGCQNVSAGCDNCYAEAMMADRYGRVVWGPHGSRSRTSVAYWRQPRKWNRDAERSSLRPKVFCASLADVFDNHGSITSGWRGDLWRLIHRTPNLDWLLLTKRPQNFAKMMPEAYGAPAWGDGWPNVWLGVTAENQQEAERRIPILLSTPATVHFVSAEPLLGPIALKPCWLHEMTLCGDCPSSLPGTMIDCPSADNRLDWIVAGGESGFGARPAHPDWFRKLRDDCAASDVAYLHKQNGHWLAEGQAPPAGGWKVDPLARRWCTVEDGSDRYTNTAAAVHAVGKARAGRLLDGVEWTQFPGERP